MLSSLVLFCPALSTHLVYSSLLVLSTLVYSSNLVLSSLVLSSLVYSTLLILSCPVLCCPVQSCFVQTLSTRLVPSYLLVLSCLFVLSTFLAQSNLVKSSLVYSSLLVLSWATNSPCKIIPLVHIDAGPLISDDLIQERFLQWSAFVRPLTSKQNLGYPTVSDAASRNREHWRCTLFAEDMESSGPAICSLMKMRSLGRERPCSAITPSRLFTFTRWSNICTDAFSCCRGNVHRLNWFFSVHVEKFHGAFLCTFLIHFQKLTWVRVSPSISVRAEPSE